MKTLTKFGLVHNHITFQIQSIIGRNLCTQMKLESPIIINGRKLAANVLDKIPKQVSHFNQSFNRTP